MMVVDGLIRAMTDDEAAALRSRALDPKSLSVLSGTGSEALARLVDHRSGASDHPKPAAVVLACSCGHIVLA
jgi:hypothetical protein